MAMSLLRKAQSVDGHVLPARRFTIWALYYFLLYFGVPVMVVAFLLDAMLYVIFEYYMDTCFGVFCLFE
jgi:hypothetical protein